MARDYTAPRVRTRDAVICYDCDKQEHMSKDCRAPQEQYHGPTGRGQAGRARLNAIIPEAAGYDEGEQQDLEGTLLLFNSQVRVLFDTGASNFLFPLRLCDD